MSAYVLELDAVLGPGTWIDVELPTRAHPRVSAGIAAGVLLSR